MVLEDIKHEVQEAPYWRRSGIWEKAGLVLQDLSDRTGLSKPLLSQIEMEIVSPPVATLLKISKALNVNISFFFQDGNPEEKVVLVKKDESKVIDSRYFGREESGYYYEALAFKKSKKYMEPFLVEFKRKSLERLSYFSHEGEEFLYVLQGTLNSGPRTVTGPRSRDSSISSPRFPMLTGIRENGTKALTVVYPLRG
jgi:transcriptional regulator with XRE-family HTH domain